MPLPITQGGCRRATSYHTRWLSSCHFLSHKVAVVVPLPITQGGCRRATSHKVAVVVPLPITQGGCRRATSYHTRWLSSCHFLSHKVAVVVPLPITQGGCRRATSYHTRWLSSCHFLSHKVAVVVPLPICRLLQAIVNALNDNFHPQCFLCTHCQQPIGGGTFHMEGGQSYCDKGTHCRQQGAAAHTTNKRLFLPTVVLKHFLHYGEIEFDPSDSSFCHFVH